MRAHILSVLLAAGFFATAAQAQQFQPGEDVIVNPQAAAGGRVLLYPGGQYMRVVPILREPGAHYGVIHLHMPRHHHAVHVVRKTRPATDQALAEAPPPAPVEAPVAPPPPVHRHVRHAAPPSAPPPAPVSAPLPSDAMNGDMTTIGPAPHSAPPPRVASAEPSTPPAPTGGRNHHVIIFATGAPEPAPNALGAIKFLASDLNADLGTGSSRIQILAYGGAHGDKGTEARRLSLKRALSIRQALIDDGVPADRIDVRAMGGSDDGGPPDRVDVYVKS